MKLRADKDSDVISEKNSPQCEKLLLKQMVFFLCFRGQRLAEQMQQQNPDLVEQLRREMGPGDNNDPPPPSSN